MASGNATPNPIYGQAYRFTGKIISSATANPITGGITGPASQISKDGGPFANTTNAITEISNGVSGSGYFYLDLTAAEMTCSSCVVRVTGSNASAVEFSIYIPVCNLTPTVGRADTAAIVRIEQIIAQSYWYFFDKQSISSTLQSVYLPDGNTVFVSGAVSNDGMGGSIRNPLT
jgi:hypothetical protein